MKLITRSLYSSVEPWLFKGKVITIFGARQVGKTTLAKHILGNHGNEKDYFNCDIPSVASRFENPEPALLKRMTGNAKLIVIDEAQRISKIGMALKIMHDTMPELQIIATGSSSFTLRNQLSEPLNGRGLEFLLLPFSLSELEQVYRPAEIDALFEFFIRFGLYPEIVDKSEKEAELLVDNLASKYLYRDILELENLKKPELLLKLLQLLAFQIGSEVSRNELSLKLGVSRETVERYINLLEKAFVIFRLKPLARNQRNEISGKEKIYFYDTGIRNSIISSFQPAAIRNDIGVLFENFMIAERLKYLESFSLKRNIWFWRTHDQKEIDYIEEYNGKCHAYEFKWSGGRIRQAPFRTFSESYPGSVFKIITKDNYFEFLK